MNFPFYNSSKRLQQQLKFIVEIDKLKQITRKNLLADGSRLENDAEHSWHVTTMALVLQEYAPDNVDIDKVIRMLLLHDVVEIDAGDTFAYDIELNLDKAEREEKAAHRIFGLLPEEQKTRLQNLWIEFEEQKTNEALFAAAIDRVYPILMNFLNNGGSWKEFDVNLQQVYKRIEVMKKGAPRLHDFVMGLLKEAVEKNLLNG